jgi:L,D-transpeptidase ErfK/SrfK
MLRVTMFFLLISLNASCALAGEKYPYDDNRTAFGFVQHTRADENESLHEIARKFGLGYEELVDANPGLDPWLPPAGSEVYIPSKWVLPDTVREGIVINLAEMRLYRYTEADGRKLVSTYPIGVGIEGFNTPTGTYRITKKLKNPAWYVPKSVRKEKPELPAIVPSGDDNPLGKFAMKLSGTRYFIHGTNAPLGIGRRVSHGCIRLYPEDIRELFETTKPGTPVRIVYQPIKVGVRGDTILMEAHEDYLNRKEDPLELAVSILKEKGLFNRVDMDVVKETVEKQRGISSPLAKRILSAYRIPFTF